jgi:hypothetical protein
LSATLSWSRPTSSRCTRRQFPGSDCRRAADSLVAASLLHPRIPNRGSPGPMDAWSSETRPGRPRWPPVHPHGTLAGVQPRRGDRSPVWATVFGKADLASYPTASPRHSRCSPDSRLLVPLPRVQPGRDGPIPAPRAARRPRARANRVGDGGQLVATGFGGPMGQARDGSTVVGQRGAGVNAPGPPAIRCLLLSATSTAPGPDIGPCLDRRRI